MCRGVNVCLCLFMFVLMSVNFSYALDWITANQVTLSWEPVTALENGQPIPDGNVIKYEVFYLPENGNKAGALSPLGETPDSKYVITFTEEGNFILGVRATRWINETLKGKSRIAWTDEPAAMKNEITQGIIFYRRPGKVNGLEVLQNER